MSREMLRNIALVVQLFAIGPLVGGMLTLLRATNGGPAVTPLLNQSPVLGILLGVAIVVAACLVGLVDARFFGARSGLAGAGVMLGWAALYSARTEDLLRLYAPTKVSLAMSAEGVLVCAAALWMVRQMTRRAYAGVSPAADRSAWSAFGSQVSLLAVLASVVAAGAVAYFVAFYGGKGQTLFAGSLAGIAAGAAAAVVSAGAEGSSSKPVADPVLTAMAGVAIASVIGPATIVALHSDPLGSALAGSLRPIGYLNAFDWAAGGLMGIPIGLGWAGAHAQSDAHAEPAKAA